MKRLVKALCLFGVAWLTMFADCDRNVTKDPGFSDWCGDSLCSWKLEHGSISKVPTWDKNDFGVKFESGADAGDSANFVQISQVTFEHDAECLLFTSVGEFDTEAQLSLAADFNNDGTIDFTGQIGSAAWTQVQTEITAPKGYRGITFYLQKQGLSTAVLAQMRVQASQGCTAPPVVLHDQPVGDGCSADGGECGAGESCLLDFFGEKGICSACNPTSCPGTQVCLQYNSNMPALCAPGLRLAPSGQACVRGGDCASGTCIGAKAQPIEDDAGTCDLEALKPLDPDAGTNCKNFGALAGKCQ